MDKLKITKRIAEITEELHQITRTWVNDSTQINQLSLDHYLSNVNYLLEQVKVLRALPVDEEVSSIPVQSTNTAQTFDDLHVRLSDIQERPVETKSFTQHQEDELSLNQKLSAQLSSTNQSSSLKDQFATRELSFSINQKIYFIRELFNADANDFERVMSHLKTLDGWDEVDFYLKATCVGPYQWSEKEEAKNQLYDFLREKFQA